MIFRLAILAFILLALPANAWAIYEGFLIPNAAVAAFPPHQSRFFQQDAQILADGARGNGVVQAAGACALLQSAVPDMFTRITTGCTIVVNGTTQAVTTGNFTHSAAHATLNRFDIAGSTSAGVKTVVTGTAAASPAPPTIPDNFIVFAFVFIPAADAAIATNQITDKRIFVNTPGTGTGAGTTLSYWTKVAEGTLSNEQAMGPLATGVVINTNPTGIPTILAAQTCTNQFVRSYNASATATCATVGSSDMATTGVTGGTYGQVTVGTDGRVTAATTATDRAHGGTGQTTSPDDNVMVGDGTVWALKALPTCSGATNALTYNISTNAFGCNTISGGGSTPTGTGFTHITAGAQDAAAKLVDTADVNANQITNTKLAQMTAGTVKGRLSSTGDPQDLTAIQARSSTGINTESATGVGNTAYTILVTDKVVYTNAAFTLPRIWTLPAASAVNAGQWLCVVDGQATLTSTNTLTVTRAGSDTIAGSTSIVLSNSRERLCLISDGTATWLIPTGNLRQVGTPTAGVLAAWTNGQNLQDATVSAVSRLLGRGDSGAGGVVQEITLGSGLTMAGTTLSASGGGSGPTITTFATDSPANVSTTRVINSQTVRAARYFTTPGSITLNQLTLGISTVTTAGNMKICIYSADGATKLVDVTTGAATSSVPLSTAVSAVALPAGEYYLILGCGSSACNLLVYATPPEMGSLAAGLFGGGAPSGKKVWHGTVTHTSGTCNSTLGTVATESPTPLASPIARGDN